MAGYNQESLLSLANKIANIERGQFWGCPCSPNKPIFLGPLKNPVHISDGILIGTADGRDVQTDRQRYNGDNSPHLMLCIAYSDAT